MCVLLGLGDTELCLALLAEIFAQSHCESLGRKRNGNVGHFSVVLRHADKLNGEEAVPSFKACESLVHKGTCYLSCSVGTEIEENNAVVSLYHAVLVHNCGEHEFVRNVVLVGIFYRLNRVCLHNALAVNERGVSLFNSVPCVVTVHCIKTSRNCRNRANAYLLYLGNGFLHVLRGGGGGNVTSVQKRVDVNLVKTVFLSHFKQAEKVFHMAVNAAGREKSHKVEGAALSLAVLHSGNKRRV